MRGTNGSSLISVTLRQTGLSGFQFHVWAADGYGAGKSPPWPVDRVLGLQDEVAMLEPVFAAPATACCWWAIPVALRRR